MNVQAEVSLYPLRTDEIGSAVTRFVDYLRRPGLALEIGPMSTRVSGNPGEVFDALGDAFGRLAAEHQVVLVVKASNACPANGVSGGNQDGFPESEESPSTQTSTP